MATINPPTNAPALPDTLRQIPAIKPSPYVQDAKATEERCPRHNAVLFRLRTKNGWGQARACHFGCVLKLDSFESLLPGV